MAGSGETIAHTGRPERRKGGGGGYAEWYTKRQGGSQKGKRWGGCKGRDFVTIHRKLERQKRKKRRQNDEQEKNPKYRNRISLSKMWRSARGMRGDK